MHKLPFCNCVQNIIAITSMLSQKQKGNNCSKIIKEKKERGTGKNKRTIEKHPRQTNCDRALNFRGITMSLDEETLPLPSILPHYKQTPESRRVPFPAQLTVLHKVQLFESCVINAGKWKKSSFNVQCRRNIL